MHFVRGPLDLVADCLLRMGAGMRQQTHDIFDHDDGALDDHAEIERAQREQVGRDVPQIEAQAGKQKRERNGERDDQRAAKVAEEDEQNDRDQDDSLGQVVEHGMRGQLHQFAAIEVRNDLHARRQEMLVEEVDLLVQGGQHVVGVGAFAQQHGAGHDVGIVHDLSGLAMNGFAKLAQPDPRSLPHNADIAHAHRNPVLRFEHDGADVSRGFDQSHRPDVDGLRSALDEAAAGVDVVVCQGLLHLPDAETVGDQLVRVHLHLVLACGPAENGNVDHVRHGLQLLDDHPVLERLQLRHVIVRVGALQREKVDLPDRTVIGA